MNQIHAKQLKEDAATPLHEHSTINTTLTGASELRVAYIEACWHHDIVEQARHSFTNRVASQGISENQIDLFTVPGSLEIPLQACQHRYRCDDEGTTGFEHSVALGCADTVKFPRISRTSRFLL